MSIVLSAEEIETVEDTDYVEIPVPEWKKDAVVRLGSLTSFDYNDWVEKNGDLTVRQSGYDLIRRSLVDENGARTGTPALVEKLRQKDARVISRLLKAALSLNGMVGKGAEEIKNALSEVKPDASPVS